MGTRTGTRPTRSRRTASSSTRSRRQRPRDAAMDRLRETLWRTIANTLESRGLTQQEASYLMKDAASQVSLVVTGNIEGFSTERLLRMTRALGYDVEVVLTPSPRASGEVTARVRRVRSS